MDYSPILLSAREDEATSMDNSVPQTEIQAYLNALNRTHMACRMAANSEAFNAAEIGRNNALKWLAKHNVQVCLVAGINEAHYIVAPPLSLKEE
jgi:hypothetical protein